MLLMPLRMADSLLENKQPDFIPEKIRFIVILPASCVMAQQLDVTQMGDFVPTSFPVCPSAHPLQPFTAVSQLVNCSRDGYTALSTNLMH